jgi:predicted nucleic acid-binding protein
VNVFFDTNVLLDVLLRREPFSRDAAAVWTLAERRNINGSVSVISFTNIFYILRRLRDRSAARQAMQILRNIFTPVPFDDQILNQAIDSGFQDLEDAVQYFSAIRIGASFVLSRDPHHFPKRGPVDVVSPSEFLSAHASE